MPFASKACVNNADCLTLLQKWSKWFKTIIYLRCLNAYTEVLARATCVEIEKLAE